MTMTFKDVILLDDDENAIIPYVRPATSTTLGTVMPDNNSLEINNAGVLSTKLKVQDTVGSPIRFTYVEDNEIKATSGSLGSDTLPVYLSGGNLVACSREIPIGSTSFAPGTILWFSGNYTERPSGWYLCNGGQLSKTTYSVLYSVIGTTFNTGGEDSDKFRVPNLYNRYIKGSSVAGTYLTAGLPNITGFFPAAENIFKSGYTPPAFGAFYQYKPNVVTAGNDNSNKHFDQDVWGFKASRSSSIYGGSTTVQPPALTLVPIIKY